MPGVDFAHVRAVVPIKEVLALLGWKPRVVQGDQWRGKCPVHGSQKRTSTVFSVNLRRNIWRCFKCGVGGGVIDLYARVKQLPLFLAAMEICERTARPVPWIDRLGHPVAPPTPGPRAEQEEEPVHLPPRRYGPHARPLSR